MSTLPGADLYTRLRDLEARIAALEQGGATGLSGTDQTIKGCHDRIDAMIGAGNAAPPATPTASRVLAMDANARFPSHDVTGDLGHVGGLINKVSTTERQYRSSCKTLTGVSNNTFYDIVTLTTEGGGGNVNYNGALMGVLEIFAFARDTGSGIGTVAQRWAVVAGSRVNNAIDVTLQQIGTTVNQGTAITLTVQLKAGATASLATIEAKIVMTNLHSANRVTWRYDFISHARTSQNFITPALA